ncbi:MAG: hypothetical protein KDD89_04800 [Anaerolineales bacterium]|nr:hypothetical protein [Anaerolineales bacterium]
MRFLLREQSYERPLMAGKYEYRRDGDSVPTGAVEHWRLTAAPDGYRFLRVDLDGRASSGHSYLYLAMLDERGLVTRLQYRFWAEGWRIGGNVQREGHTAVATHTVNGETTSTEFALPASSALWFPSVAGLGLVKAGDTLTLHGRAGSKQTLHPELATVQIEHTADGAEQIRWAGAQIRTIWRDAQTGWPQRMARLAPDGVGLLTAVGTQHIKSSTIN